MKRQIHSKTRIKNWRAAAAAVVLLGGAGAAQAQVYWDGGGSPNTEWSNAANWDSFGSDATPTFVDNVYLNNGGTITISDTGNQAAAFLIGTAADTGLNANNLGLGGTVNFNAGGGLTSASSIPAVDVGVAAGSTNIWNHNGGTLTTGELFRIGVQAGSTGTLNMHDGLIDVSTGDNAGLDFFLVGDNGNGTMNMDGGTVRSRGLFGVALQPASTSSLTMSAGTIETNTDAIFGGNTNNGAQIGGRATVALSGGTIRARFQVAFGNSHYASATMNHSGGSLEANEILIGKWTDTTYTLSGSSSIVASGQLNLGTFTPIERPEGAANAPLVTMTQSGTSSITAGGLLVGEMGRARYTLNSGTINVTGVIGPGGGVPGPEWLNMIVGRDGGGHRQGLGEFNQNGGAVTVASNLVLGDFDDSTGRYTISGGSLNVTGTAQIGAALATNAPPDATRLEPSLANGAQGQALNTRGEFTVRGGAATINFGKLLANPADKGAFRNGPGQENHATLAFEIGNAGALSVINVAGVADVDGAVIDMGFMADSTFVPAYQQQFVLVNASLFGATGTGTTQNVGTGSTVTLGSSDASGWTVSVIPASGGRQSLVAINQVVPGDTNGNRIVNFDDLLTLAQNYGFGAAVVLDPAGLDLPGNIARDWALALSLVPEPASLLSGAGLGLLLRRRRSSTASQC